MGDATNLVLILAGELLKRAEHLLVMGLHPSEVVIGYEMAVEKGRQELECTSCCEDAFCRSVLILFPPASNGTKEPRQHRSPYPSRTRCCRLTLPRGQTARLGKVFVGTRSGSRVGRHADVAQGLQRG
jgi:hypothetical protein